MIQVPDDIYKQLEKIIESDSSPVGIDAKTTHIMILHMLIKIDKRLESLTGQ